MRILREKANGLIIDIQEKLYPHIHDHEHLLTNTKKLVAGLKILNVPVMVTQQYTKGLGETISPLRKVLGDFHPVEKKAFSCCDEPAFATELARTEKKFIIIAGIETHVCVLQTVLDLIDCGHVPVVVEDCVSSRQPGDRNTALQRIRQEGAPVTSCESVLFELCRVAGTDEFKAISKLLK